MATFPASVIITDTSNATDAAMMHTIASMALVEAPLFGWLQLQTSVSISALNGRTWSMSVRTLDVVATISICILLTFAVDHYYFRSRYLVHIGGARRAVINACPSQEKDVPDLESGLDASSEADIKPQTLSVPLNDGTANSMSAGPSRRWLHRATLITVILCFSPLFGYGNTKAEEGGGARIVSMSEPSKFSGSIENTTELEAESRPRTRLDRFISHLWVRKASAAALRVGAWLLLVIVFLWQSLFWPAIFGLSVLMQEVIHISLYSDPNSAFSWNSFVITGLMSLVRLTIWTAAAVTLLLRPSRVQGLLWKCFRWTHAISWWLWFVGLQAFVHARRLPQLLGLPRIPLGNVYMVAVQPSLTIVYLYSGLVCNLVVVILMVRKLWKADLGI